MNKKTLIIIASIIGVLVFGMVGFTIVKGVIIKNDPFNYLMYSAFTNDYDAVDASIEGGLVLDEEAFEQNLAFMSQDPAAMAKFISEMMMGMQFTGDVKWKSDIKNQTFYLYEGIQLNYANQPLLDFSLSLDEQMMRFGSKLIGGKSFELSKEDIFDMIEASSGTDLSKLDYQKYIAVLDMEKDPLYKAFIKDYDGYADIMRNRMAALEKGDKRTVALSDGSTVKCDTIILNTNMNEMTLLLVEMLTEAKTDNELKALAKGKILEVLALFVSSGDYELLNVPLADVEAAIESVETSFDEEWNALLDELIYTYQEAQYTLSQTMPQESPYTIAFAIDRKYQIREMVYKTSVMGIGMEQRIVYNAFGKDVKLPEAPLSEDVISIKALSEDEVYANEVLLEILDTGVENVIEGPALNTIMSDLDSKSVGLPEAERQGIVEMVNYFFDNKEELKELLRSGFGL